MKRVVGYTTGVFDLFHIGHLNILERAKGMCDKLIVGVTSDKLVAYKNKEAVIPYEQRARIVNALECVDVVVCQDSMDKLEAWRKLKFDVMFVGSDWHGTAKWNEFDRQFKALGVDIVYFDYTEDISSTKINKILEGERDGRGAQAHEHDFVAKVNEGVVCACGTTWDEHMHEVAK